MCESSRVMVSYLPSTYFWQMPRLHAAMRAQSPSRLPLTLRGLHSCYVRTTKEKDKPGDPPAYCIELDARHGPLNRQYFLYAANEMEREEWVHVLRKHAVNSSIDNGYEIRRDDKDTKLGSGSYSTVWKGSDRETKKVRAYSPLCFARFAAGPWLLPSEPAPRAPGVGFERDA